MCGFVLAERGAATGHHRKPDDIPQRCAILRARQGSLQGLVWRLLGFNRLSAAADPANPESSPVPID